MKLKYRFAVLIFVAGCAVAEAGEPVQQKKEMILPNLTANEERESDELMVSTKRPLPKAPEELDGVERSQQIKTWLERSKSYLAINQFDLALESAEQVFLLDPENLEASRILDEIREEARLQGKSESVFLERLYEEEVDERVGRYLNEGDERIRKGQWQAARFAIQKALILDPESYEANELQAICDARDETRKTL